MCYSKNQCRYDGWMHSSGKVNEGATRLATGAYSTPCNARNTNPRSSVSARYPNHPPMHDARQARAARSFDGTFFVSRCRTLDNSVGQSTNQVRVLLAQNTASACQVINFRGRVCRHTFRNNDRRGLTPQRPSDPTQRAVKAAQSVMYKKGKCRSESSSEWIYPY